MSSYKSQVKQVNYLLWRAYEVFKLLINSVQVTSQKKNHKINLGVFKYVKSQVKRVNSFKSYLV